MLHTNFKSALVKTFTLIVLCLTVFAYAGKAGGDKYRIYLNDKVITEQYVGRLAVDISSLPLDKANYKDKLVIYYSHCGTVGTGRSIVLKDEQNKVVKEWKFADGDASMSIPVKDIFDLQKSNATLKLYYFSSRYLPKGRMLTSIKLKDKNLAQHNSEKAKYLSAFTAGILGLAAGYIFWRK